MARTVVSGFKLPGNEVFHSPIFIAETKSGKFGSNHLPHMPSRRGDTFAFTVIKNVVYYFKPLDTQHLIEKKIHIWRCNALLWDCKPLFTFGKKKI